MCRFRIDLLSIFQGPHIDQIPFVMRFPLFQEVVFFVLVVFYFVLIRPQNKKEKAQQKMRSEISIGDEITSIGGIVGRIISIKEDNILIESGSDRIKLRLKKWAIQEVTKLDLD